MELVRKGEHVVVAGMQDRPIEKFVVHLDAEERRLLVELVGRCLDGAPGWPPTEGTNASTTKDRVGHRLAPT
jgi:hypothetical protein